MDPESNSEFVTEEASVSRSTQQIKTACEQLEEAKELLVVTSEFVHDVYHTLPGDTKDWHSCSRFVCRRVQVFLDQ